MAADDNSQGLPGKDQIKHGGGGKGHLNSQNIHIHHRFTVSCITHRNEESNMRKTQYIIDQYIAKRKASCLTTRRTCRTYFV
jgi:hypothetical protein